MFSKRELEGYLLIDHSDSPGFTPEEAQAGGWGKTMPVGSKKFEFATYTCSHCQRMVVRNPGRERERGYCPKCDRIVCDECEAARVQTGICKPFSQVVDEYIENLAKGRILIPFSDKTSSGSAMDGA